MDFRRYDKNTFVCTECLEFCCTANVDFNEHEIYSYCCEKKAILLHDEKVGEFLDVYSKNRYKENIVSFLEENLSSHFDAFMGDEEKKCKEDSAMSIAFTNL